MNNVIPLKRSEHVISDAELDILALDLARMARKYGDFQSLPAMIRKTLSDALKRDQPKTFADEILERNMASWRADLNKEREDGDTERGPSAS